MAQKYSNPFYVLLVIAGVAFGITACAYVVMTVKMSTAAGIASAGDLPAVKFMSEHGGTVLIVELVVLAVTSFAAMATDSYWIKNKP
jgi:hypothetical protein